MTYKVVRSNRKTICICVSSENEVTVRCPMKISDKKIDEFVKSKREWLLKVLYTNELKLSENESITQYKEIFVTGVKLPLIIGMQNELTASAVYVKDLKEVKNLFISVFGSNFIRFVESVSLQCNLFVNKIDIKSYKRRWGCCDRNGKITFNYMIFMLPQSLQRYVVVHELCHTAFFNHSSEFWKLVERFEPEYKKLRKQLNGFSFVTNLYK